MPIAFFREIINASMQLHCVINKRTIGSLLGTQYSKMSNIGGKDASHWPFAESENRMRADSRDVRLSASDLSNHLACHHLTQLDLAVALGELVAPRWNSPDTWVLQQRGMEHEAAYLKHLEGAGCGIRGM